jgi:integrase
MEKPLLCCPSCGNSLRLYRDGTRVLSDGRVTQRWLCPCGYRFSEGHTLSNANHTYSGKRQVCDFLTEDSKNLNATETKTVAGERKDAADLKGKLVQFAWHLQKQNYTPDTVRDYSVGMRALVHNNVDVGDPEKVKEFLVGFKRSETYKHVIAAAYTLFLKMQGQTWEQPLFRPCRKLPFIPQERELDDLIAGVGKKTAAFLETLKQTGARMGEISRLTWDCVDIERKAVTINNPEKNGVPRILNVNDKLVNMLGTLPRKNEYVFGSNSKSTRNSLYYRERKKVAYKLGNPRLLKIGLHTFRHWRATMMYHETRDPALVMEALGHRSITTTMLYIHLEKALFKTENSGFQVKATKEAEEVKGLLEVGFEYVCEKDGLMFFRKRK